MRTWKGESAKGRKRDDKKEAQEAFEDAIEKGKSRKFKRINAFTLEASFHCSETFLFAK
jgi:hypothetical protein